MKLMLLLSGLIIGSFTYAQTADEILAQYFETVGGLEEWKKVKSTKSTAKVITQGLEIPLEIWMFTDGRMYTSFTLQGKKMVQVAFDGKKGYEMNFMTGKMEEMDKERVENLKRSIGDYPSPFIDYKTKGYTVEKLDDEVVEGTTCYKLKLISGKKLVDGKEVDRVSYHYFDKETFVPIVEETEILVGELAGKLSQTILSDYTEVDNLYFPYSIIQKIAGGQGQGQTITFEKIEINPKEDKTLFDFSSY